MRMERFYTTTAIDYVNGAPHIGHAYEKILTDVIYRHFTQRCEDTYFLSGTDEHGIKIQKTSAAQGMKPKELCDMNAQKFQDAWKALNVEYSQFIRTTDSQHEEIVQKIFDKLLKKGEFSVAFSYDVHSYNTPVNSKVYYLIIPTRFCGELLPQLTSKNIASPFINNQKTYDIVRSSIKHLIDGANEISQKGYVYVILGAILEQMSANVTSDSSDSRFSPELLIYLSQNFREELTLPMLATKFGYNPSYLSRNFSKTFGISFNKYLTMLRLREAILLMRSGKMNITECALESGFGSMRSFYRAFREEFGCTPKEYFDKEQNK